MEDVNSWVKEVVGSLNGSNMVLCRSMVFFYFTWIFSLLLYLGYWIDAWVATPGCYIRPTSHDETFWCIILLFSMVRVGIIH